jgi:ankyrin repeat protein
MADAMELSKQVSDICDTKDDPSTELRAFLDAHPQVSVTQYRDQRGEQALHWASRRGHAACVRMLLDHGADVHARNNTGWNALMHTSAWTKLECMQVLIEAKADVNASDGYGRTAAHVASSSRGNIKCLQLLIDSRADVNAQISGGQTPAMEACTAGSLPCLQLLVDNKADLNVRGDRHQDDALYQAMLGTAYRIRSQMTFAVLSCNTDAKNVMIDYYRVVTTGIVAAFIERYKHIQAYIDEL